ncbi:MauE/DoxX family redox-associated membrane protein [Curvibacter lanceolatus]|uniref:MauE/DoxX family redox-associated membrane protein n=1 Tax=Curvibacter lanceolatus TaxID=86182 RepID=UPI000367FA69|nr:MauE/DoxX family redox-associated membrane protein [Curvibacter lanceolatus]
MLDTVNTALPWLDPVLSHAAAASLALVLLFGALAKLRDLSAFVMATEAYGLLPPLLVSPVAHALALSEAAAGLLLLPVSTRPLGAALALGVLGVASSAVALALRQGRSIDCGCGGYGSRGSGLTLSGALLWRNAALLGLGLAALAPLAPRPVGWADGLAACAAALFAIGLYAVTNQLLSNQPRLAELRNNHD